MDDNEIINKGGNQDDINNISKQNGADLTELDILEDYFYRYFSIPEYDNIDIKIRMGKREFLEKLKTVILKELN